MKEWKENEFAWLLSFESTMNATMIVETSVICTVCETPSPFQLHPRGLSLSLFFFLFLFTSKLFFSPLVLFNFCHFFLLLLLLSMKQFLFRTFATFVTFFKVVFIFDFFNWSLQISLHFIIISMSRSLSNIHWFFVLFFLVGNALQKWRSKSREFPF